MQSSAQQPQPLVIGDVLTLSSVNLKEERIVNVYKPAGYDPAKAYPVFYVLDGGMDQDFPHVAGVIQFFEMQLGMPPALVVGIANVDRRRDFTFPTELADLKRDFPTTGHSAEFIAFVEKELQPKIELTYKTNGTKFLIGQSLGGLVATEILLTRPQLFTHYFIISPSLWWDNQSLISKMDAALTKIRDSKYVYLAVGKGEEKIMQQDAATFARKMKEHPKIRLDYLVMENEDHATILHNAVYQGLGHLFLKKK